MVIFFNKQDEEIGIFLDFTELNTTLVAKDSMNTAGQTAELNTLIDDIQYNCNISDARDHGIYSMCTMVLKLRNLYKWEKGIEPWDEPEPGELLDWIEAKENYWESLADKPFRRLAINGQSYSPVDCTEINALFQGEKLVYGAGYGRSMKAVFYVAELLEERIVGGCPVVIMGNERAKEMASPFAMAQEGTVFIRREPLRYFLWDQINELRSSCRASFRHGLLLHGLLKDDQLDIDTFKEKLDVIVDQEMDIFIYHEVGELLQDILDSATLQKIVHTFPNSVIELICRSIKDILADTHPAGLIAHLLQKKRQTSLSFYVGFLDGMRKELFPEIVKAWNDFNTSSDWHLIEQAREMGRTRLLELAKTIRKLADEIGESPDELIMQQFNTRVLSPLGLDTPVK